MAVPTFTIIVPTYNSELHLKGCVESILCQDFDLKKVELILIDDCSLDSTWSILNSYQSFDVLYNYSLRRTKKNSGPGIARNIGIDLASGELIVFVDSDDILNPDFLSSIYQANISKPDIIYYDGYTTSSNLQFRICKHENMYSGSVLEKAKQILNLETNEHVIFAAYSNKLLQKIPKFKVGLHEDIEFSSMTYLEANDIYHLNKMIYRKNIVLGQITENVTTSKGIQYLTARINLGNNILAMMPNMHDEIKIFYNSGIRGAVALILNKMSNFYVNSLDFDIELDKIFSFLSHNLENTDIVFLSNIFTEKDEQSYGYYIYWKERKSGSR